MALNLLNPSKSSCSLGATERVLRTVSPSSSISTNSPSACKAATHAPSTSPAKIALSGTHPPYQNSGSSDVVARIPSAGSFERGRRRTGRLISSSNSQSSETEAGSDTRKQSADEPSAQSHMNLLERLTSESGSVSSANRTIAQQLAADQEFNSSSDEVTIPLGSGRLEMEPLTIAQKRNIRRQDYLNEVAKRNDVPFFTAVALFVIVPPAAILGVAVATGYVDLFP